MHENGKDSEEHWIVPIHLADYLAPILFANVNKYEKKSKKFLKGFGRERIYHHEVVIALMVLSAALTRDENPNHIVQTFMSVLSTIGQVGFGTQPEVINKNIH